MILLTIPSSAQPCRHDAKGLSRAAVNREGQPICLPCAVEGIWMQRNEASKRIKALTSRRHGYDYDRHRHWWS